MNMAMVQQFFTRDGDAARSYADQIEIGMVGINVPIPGPVAYHSFGGLEAVLSLVIMVHMGWKRSGSTPV
jgi:NAD-dependent aldehyde dehydrogenases